MRVTSTTDPIRVDFIAASPFPGRLGLTIAPGKKGASSVSSVHWDRDLDADLDTLVHVHGAEVLVSLMEPHEYEMLEVPLLLDRARAIGLVVRSLPIRDVSVPRPDQAPAFDALLDAVVADLEVGRSVVVHCRGGLGRSGLLAACALTHGGLPADDAVALVRRYRRGAVETAEQARFVGAYARRRKSAIPAG